MGRKRIGRACVEPLPINLAAANRYGYVRHVAHQVYYSLLNRDYEWELMGLGRDQGVGALIWSPLGIIGARNEEQLMQNIGAAGWALTPSQVATLDAASDAPPSYPAWHQRGFPMLNEGGA
jgi:aryl-alcohol dehydrogenase-like predicted oxidoreductase